MTTHDFAKWKGNESMDRTMIKMDFQWVEAATANMNYQTNTKIMFAVYSVATLISGLSLKNQTLKWSKMTTNHRAGLESHGFLLLFP